MPRLCSDLLASRAGLEAVLGAAADVLEVAHAAVPVVFLRLAFWPHSYERILAAVTARSADLLLTVEGARVAAAADGVCVLVL